METRTVSAFHSNDTINNDAINAAADLLKAGEIVAIPTETVYGLAANALDAAAVAKIFEAKGRPANNPLIVHVESIEQAKSLVAHWPPEAEKLAEKFWPGPLTIVLKKSSAVPDITTADGDTVAIRCPDHPAALTLIRACGFPLAAPSANRSNYISPTTAHHVIKSLDGCVPLILDGGPCPTGIESTVLSLVEMPTKILRPGSITAYMIKKECGIKMSARKVKPAKSAEETMASPGQMPTHYAPSTPLILAKSGAGTAEMSRLRIEGKRVALMQILPQGGGRYYMPVTVLGLTLQPMPNNPRTYGRLLYSILHNLDEMGFDAIVCEEVPTGATWDAVRDRLTRAAKSS